MNLMKKLVIGLVVVVLGGCSGGGASEEGTPVGNALSFCVHLAVDDVGVFNDFEYEFSAEEEELLGQFGFSDLADARGKDQFSALSFLVFYDDQDDTSSISGGTRQDGIAVTSELDGELRIGVAACMIALMLSEIDAQDVMSATAQTGPKRALSKDGQVEIMFAYDGRDETFTFIAEPVD